MTKILAQDISTDKTAGDYIMGIYAWGPKSTVTLQDSNIKVVSKGNNSFTVKIGNFENNGTGYKGEVISKGTMRLDSTEAPNAPTILLVNSDSSLDASAATASTNIKSANSAIVFGVTDLRYKNALGAGGDLTRNKSAENQSVKLNNATISTTSETASLIKVDSINEHSFANQFAGIGWSNGNFFTKGKFVLSGAKSLIKAAKNGWLIEVENGSELTVLLKEKAQMVGQVTNNTGGKLDLTIDDSTWKLAQKGAASEVQRSSLNSLTLTNNAVLDATQSTAKNQDDLNAPIQPAQRAVDIAETNIKAAKQNFKFRDDRVNTRLIKIAAAEKTIEDAKNLTADPGESDTDFQARKQNIIDAAQAIIDDEKKRLPTSEARLAEAKIKLENAEKALEAAQKDLASVKAIAAAGPKEAADYFIKLTSDGTLTNDGSVITLANNSYKDILTIEGNYEGKNGIIKMNTLWNSPGDDVDGTDSESDLLHITGTATGVTTVIPIDKNGAMNVIDGSIQQIAASELNTIPVVKVDTNNDGSNFIGTASTTGAGMAVLTHRDKAGVREYYWTIKAKSGTDIYDPVVPAYTLAGKTDLELGYTTLATLHERRGENQTLAWDDCGSCGEKAKGQSWGRIFGKYLELAGKTRLGAKHNIFGFQLGHDFAISHTDEGGHRLTGAYVSYGKMSSKYNDLFRVDEYAQIATDKHTGNGTQTGWNLGVTHTRYAPTGAYVDLVGQIGFLKNKFDARNGVEAKQKGIALGLSAEVGRPYALREHKSNEGVWLIEPQAQLVYQMLKLNDFNDGTKHIQGDIHHGLRGRLGVRLAYNTQAAEDKLRTKTFYLIANILQDFKNGKAVQIGQDFVKETHAKTWAELGLGGQLPVGKQSYIYADARYEHSLGGTKREGYRGSVGIKYTWK